MQQRTAILASKERTNSLGTGLKNRATAPQFYWLGAHECALGDSFRLRTAILASTRRDDDMEPYKGVPN